MYKVQGTLLYILNLNLAAVPAGHHELLAGAARGEVRVDACGVEEAAVAGGLPSLGMVTRPMVIVMLFTV